LVEGTIKYDNGVIEEGKFKLSMKNVEKIEQLQGEGKKLYANGDEYHGSFKVGTRQGYGTLIHFSGF